MVMMVVGWSGGGVASRHAFSLKAAIGRTVLGWIANPSTLLCPNREELSGTVEAAPLWLLGGGGCYRSTPAALVVAIVPELLVVGVNEQQQFDSNRIISEIKNVINFTIHAFFYLLYVFFFTLVGFQRRLFKPEVPIIVNEVQFIPGTDQKEREKSRLCVRHLTKVPLDNSAVSPANQLRRGLPLVAEGVYHLECQHARLSAPSSTFYAFLFSHLFIFYRPGLTSS